MARGLDYWISTILSNPAEYWSLFLGLVALGALVYFTDDPPEAVLGAIVIGIVAIWFVPERITAEWHYWVGIILAGLALGVYEYGPENPV